MYSVEDLLISHGYKVPKHTASSATSTPARISSSHQAPSSSQPSYNKHNEILENVPSPRTVNGYEQGPYGNSGGTKQPHVCHCPSNNNVPRDRSQFRQEGGSRTDTHLLTPDSGVCDGTKGLQSQAKDVSYWRRKGQDFTVLLDYTDFRESHCGRQGDYCRPDGPQQARGQEMSEIKHQRGAHERRHWTAHIQGQAPSKKELHSREREAALHQWRLVAERKCQSLGNDNWRPAVNFGRQMSQSEGERWTQEKQRLHVRTPEGVIIHPRTKAKSQSLPRMLQPESLHYVDIASSGQDLYRRINGHPLAHHDFYRAPRWPENGRPASATQLSVTPKPRFTRPPRPPSYEMHQQIRGSCEVLSGRDSVIPQARERTPIPISRTGEAQLDYFAQDSGPPGYIPPPSYKRGPVMGGGHRGFGEIPVHYRYKGGVYQQIHMAPDGSHWITRHPVGFWPDLQRERNMSGQKQPYPVYTSQEHHGGGIQYIPFDDPRIRHISSALGGNSLTDADKIRHICNELPSVTVSEPSTINSAFLPPPLAPSITAKLAADANQTCSTNLDNDSNRWHSDLHNETVDNFQAIDQNCNNRYPKKCHPPPSPSSAFQVPLTRISSQQGTSLDHVFAETITQVKKIVPDSGTENNSNTKRRVSETIFCLVSVPVHTPTNINKDLAADQNNNETIQGLTVTTDTFAVGLKESLNIRSKSVNEMPMKSHYARFHTSSTSSLKNYKRAPLRKEIIDAWILQANEEKEICYTGSWPGNQYRNQETQTGSPLTVLKSPESQSPPTHGQEPVQPVSGTTTESDLSTEYCHSYGYPMAGQKNLQLSSNSAFSRLSLSPTQLSLTQAPLSPSKTQTQESAEQVAFGQFLLKPVNRRPFDAIGELESINKEMEDTISKRPNVAKHHDGLNGLNDRIQQFQLAHFTVGLDLDREAISLPPMHTDKPSNQKVRSKSFASSTDLAFMDREIVFSKIQTNSVPPANELSLPTNQGVSDGCLLPLHSSQNGSNQLYRQDIPVLQDSLLRDVGLTVYTETPGGPGEPIKRSLSVPSPLDLNKLSESVQELWENRTAQVQSRGGLKDNSNKDLPDRLQTKRKAKSDSDVPSSGHVNLRICRSDSDNSCKKHISSIITQRRREVSFVFKTNDNDVRSTISEPLIYKNESTIADKHLQNLLILEKANSLSAQDLSNLYEVKCAKGIPENESIEQRAARILGISVPVEALGVGEKQSERKHNGDDDDDDDDEEEDDDDEDATVSDKLRNPPEETEKLIEEGKKVKDALTVEATREELNGTEGNCEEVIQKHSDDNDSKKNLDIEFQSMLVLDLPEFPPSTLPLSLPVTPNEKQALGMCTGEKRGQNGACKATESLQHKINCLSASSPGRSATDRTARLKELDSVSRIRQLSLKGSQSEKKESEKNPSDIPKQKLEADDDGKAELEREKKGEMNKKESSSVGYPDVACTSKETTQETDGKCQRKEEKTKEIKDMVAIKSEIESAKGDVNFKSKGAVLELSLAEDDKEKPLKNEEKKTSKVQRVEGVHRGMMPKPRQRTKLQKPPLLPKPLSVPKREITLPLRTSTSTCSPSGMDDEEVHSVSDSYDPTRVEQV